MEKISDHLRSVRSKKESLRADFERVLLFGLQWENVEEHFDSFAASIDQRFENLKVREALAEDKLRAAESKEKEFAASCDAEILGKQEDLGLLGKRIEECMSELSTKEELVSVGDSVEACRGKLGKKKKQKLDVQKVVNILAGCCEGLHEKTKSLLSVQDELRSCASELLSCSMACRAGKSKCQEENGPAQQKIVTEKDVNRSHVPEEEEAEEEEVMEDGEPREMESEAETDQKEEDEEEVMVDEGSQEMESEAETDQDEEEEEEVMQDGELLVMESDAKADQDAGSTEEVVVQNAGSDVEPNTIKGRLRRKAAEEVGCGDSEETG